MFALFFLLLSFVDDPSLPRLFQSTAADHSIYISTIRPKADGAYIHSLIKRGSGRVLAIESYLACEQVQLELEVTASQKRVLDKVLEESKAFALKLREVPLLNYDKQLNDETRQHLVEQLNGVFIETQVERFYQLQDWYDLRRLGVLHFVAIRSGNQKLLHELLPWHKQIQEEFAARHEKDYEQLIDELLQPLSKEQRETILNEKWFSIPAGLEVLILSLEQASKRAIENPDGDISLLEMALFGGLYHQLDHGGTWNSIYHSPARMIGTTEIARRMINDQVLDIPIEIRQELKLCFQLQQQREVDIRSRAAKIYLETGSNEALEYQKKTLRESRSDCAKEIQELLNDPTLSPALEYLAAENERRLGFMLSIVESKSMRKRFDITDQQLNQMLSKSRKIVSKAKNLLLDYELEIVERLQKKLGKSVELVANLHTDRPQHGFPSLLILLSDSQQWQEMFLTDEEKYLRAMENSK